MMRLKLIPTTSVLVDFGGFDKRHGAQKLSKLRELRVSNRKQFLKINCRKKCKEKDNQSTYPRMCGKES